MNAFSQMMKIIEKLETAGIHYSLHKYSTENDRITIEAAIPGDRWEIEVDGAGNIFLERFRSSGVIYDEGELDRMLTEMQEDESR